MWRSREVRCAVCGRWFTRRLNKRVLIWVQRNGTTCSWDCELLAAGGVWPYGGTDNREE